MGVCSQISARWNGREVQSQTCSDAFQPDPSIEDLETGQIDVNNAFTEASLAHLIYKEPPPGMDVKPGESLRLLQSLYGLKQAAYDWYFTCNGELTTLGFVSSDSDPCMYINKGRKLIVLVYVDDISIAA